MGDKRYTNFNEWYEAVGKTLTDKRYCSLEAWDAGLNSNYDEDVKLQQRIKELEESIEEIYKITDTGDITDPWIRQKIYEIAQKAKQK